MKPATLILVGLALLLGNAQSARADLVINGGFATGDFTGWTTSGNFQYTSVETHFDYYTPQSGPFFASLGPVGSDGVLSQNLSTTSGQQYQLSFYLASNGGLNNDFSAMLGGTPVFSTTNIAATASTGTAANLNYSYVEHTFDFTATSSTTSLAFAFRDDPGYLALDNVSVTGINNNNKNQPAFGTPEPSGLALLGTSVLCLAVGYSVWRRKLAAA